MLLEGKALPALFHDEGGDAPGPNVRRCHREHHIGIRHAAIGDEDLLAVQQPVIAFILGGGLGTAGVGTGVRLCQAESADLFSGTEIQQILFLLLLRTEGGDGECPQGRVGRQDHACAAVHPGQFLHSDGIAEHIQPCAAVLLFIGDSHEAHLSQFLHGLCGKLVLLVQLEGNGLDFRLRKLAYLCPQLFLGLGGLIVHTLSSFSVFQVSRLNF